MALTPSQQAAVECDTNLVVFAGPGSGKTATSVAKAIHVLRDPGRRMMLCTFTVEAARELDTRLKRALEAHDIADVGPRCRVGTLDSFAYQHLRSLSALPAKLLSPKAGGALVRQALRNLGLSSEADAVQPLFERLQCSMEPAAVLADIARQDPERGPTLSSLYREYQSLLAAAGYTDLATIKRVCAQRLASGDLSLFRTAAGHATDLLIDEVQDCDSIQMSIGLSHAQRGCTVTLVGDDDQCIYSWRGAVGIEGIKLFVGSLQPKPNIAILEENFRSHSEIVERAARVIAFNAESREPKRQRAVKGPGGQVLLYSCDDVETECERVAKVIAADPARWGSVAILARLNSALNCAEAALDEMVPSIAYDRPGGSRFWDLPLVVSYLALLRFLCWGAADQLVLVLGYFEFDAAVVRDLAGKARDGDGTLLRDGTVPDCDFMTPLDRARLERLSAALLQQANQLNRYGWVVGVLPNLGDLFCHLAYGGSGEPALPDEPPRQNTREQRTLVEAIARVNKRLLAMPGDLMLTRRLEKLDHAFRANAGAEHNRVQLLTLHGSKGLEFDTVFMIDCALRDADRTLVHGPSERRTFYVGMTRARKCLQMSFTGTFPLFVAEAGFMRSDAQAIAKSPRSSPAAGGAPDSARPV